MPPREEAGSVVEGWPKPPPPKILPRVPELDGLAGAGLEADLDGKLKRPLPTVGAAVEALLLLPVLDGVKTEICNKVSQLPSPNKTEVTQQLEAAGFVEFAVVSPGLGRLNVDVPVKRELVLAAGEAVVGVPKILAVVGAAVDPAPPNSPVPGGFGPPNKPPPVLEVGVFEVFALEKRPADAPGAGVGAALFRPPPNILPPV